MKLLSQQEAQQIDLELMDPEKGGKIIWGQLLKMRGGWKDPLVSKQLMAALHLAHAARGQAGPYQEKCEQCVSGKTACNRPHSIPHLWRLGDPTKVSLVSNQQKSVIKSNKEYIVQGDMPVTVDELLKIRNYLVSQNSTEVSQS